MSSSAIDLAELLEDLGRGTVGTTIFTNQKPSTPDAVICLFDYAGQAPEWTSTSKYDKPSLQVLVRDVANSDGAALALAETIYKDLDGFTGIVNGTYFLKVEAIQSGPTPMGKDEIGRIEYVWNFYVKKLR
jgi:hypothetical protein